MKKLVLLGDSIRLIGYGTRLAEIMSDEYEVWQPEDNCRWADYTYRMLSDKASEIIRRLLSFGVTRFRALFKGNRSRSEIVATFIAVLELCKARRVRLAGTEMDCTVTCTDEGENMEDFVADTY